MRKTRLRSFFQNAAIAVMHYPPRNGPPPSLRTLVGMLPGASANVLAS